MGYDLYPMDTLAFKRAFVREAIEREYLIFFEHDPDVAAGYIREDNGASTSSACCERTCQSRHARWSRCHDDHEELSGFRDVWFR